MFINVLLLLLCTFIGFIALCYIQCTVYCRYIYQRGETYISGAKSRTDFYGNIADSWRNSTQFVE
jgi:hypothetical protein